MLERSKAFSGFAVRDIAAAKTFYTDRLGLDVTEENGMLTLRFAGGRPTLDHVPATYTILNFPVDDIEAAVDELTARGVSFEHYEGTPAETDARGVFRGGGPLIAWFTDPSGNIMSVIEAPGPGE